MPSCTIEQRAAVPRDRIGRLRHAVQTAKPGVCTERAVIWTRYFKNRSNRRKPMVLQMAEALSEVLRDKSIAIHRDEWIVGNFSSKSVGGSIYPELHGVPVLEDLFRFNTRKTNPLQISRREIWSLIKIVPFWMFRFLGLRAYRSPLKKLRFLLDQLRGHFYLINESGGIAHLAPDYERLIRVGASGIAQDAERNLANHVPGSEKHQFLHSIIVMAEGLSQFGERYATLAGDLAAQESDAERKAELLTIERVCRRVPRHPARNFHEALQSTFFAQIALNLESLDNAICPGRMDQYLYPYFARDLETGILTRGQAKDLVATFSIKMSEIVPIFSNRLTRFHGGLFNGQVVTVGGLDENGEGAENDLSVVFLEVMNELRMRQPNFHARIHRKSPDEYVGRIVDILASGANSPALYNDDVIIETLKRSGYETPDARTYTGVGCVEPVCQGKSFASTDAALVNVPILLEMALNEGRRFGSLWRTGAKTQPVSHMVSMQDVKTAWETQLRHRLEKLIGDLHAVERANAAFHPTPLTSMLLDGCIASATCSTQGGARYNFSGIQCVGVSDVGDALFAIDEVAFREKKISLPDLVSMLKRNIPDPFWLASLRNLGKFGNDRVDVDAWTLYVAETFNQVLQGRQNTRGGAYTTGLYSVTAHQFFGQVTGALPHGRRRGEPFASGLAPGNGMDRLGPTALLNSVNRFDFTQMANGINLNLKIDHHTLRGETGSCALKSLLKTYFRRGGMQVQFNVLDPKILIEARDFPDRHPNLLIRVSGYSAYFNDLTPAMKNEIIARSSLASSG